MVLSGCGVFDGSEITEAVGTIVHLSKRDCKYTIFAPDGPQLHVIDHSKGQVTDESRNVLAESARIARGKALPLSQLKSQGFDGVLFPGGFGAAKNLSTFASDGVDMKVHPEVERVIREFHGSRKPIGLCCIAPVLAAKVLGEYGVEVTVGQAKQNAVTEDGKWPYTGTAHAIESFGARHVVKDLVDSHVDVENLVVTSPAYMCEAAPHEVFESVGMMVKGVLGLAYDLRLFDQQHAQEHHHHHHEHSHSHGGKPCGGHH